MGSAAAVLQDRRRYMGYLCYANRHLFLVELQSMHGEELRYPHFSPPQHILLQTQSAQDYRNSFVRYGSTTHFLPTVFSHLIVKELSQVDVIAGRLVCLCLLFLSVVCTF